MVSDVRCDVGLFFLTPRTCRSDHCVPMATFTRGIFLLQITRVNDNLENAGIAANLSTTTSVSVCENLCTRGNLTTIHCSLSFSSQSLAGRGKVVVNWYTTAYLVSRLVVRLCVWKGLAVVKQQTSGGKHANWKSNERKSFSGLGKTFAWLILQIRRGKGCLDRGDMHVTACVFVKCFNKNKTQQLGKWRVDSHINVCVCVCAT